MICDAPSRAEGDGERSADSQRTPRPGVIERLTQILDVVAHSGDRALLEDIAAATGLPRSTAFRLITQMTELDWLAPRPGGGYQLSRRAHRMGAISGSRSEIRAAASDHLHTLHLQTGGIAHLSVLVGAQVQYLDKIGGFDMQSIPSAVGARMPANITVSGRSLLACMPADWVAETFTPDTCPGDSWDRHVAGLAAAIKLRGVAAVSADIHPLRITNVAAPVMGPDGAVAAISVAVRGRSVSRVTPLVTLAARHTSETLHPQWFARQRRTPAAAAHLP